MTAAEVPSPIVRGPQVWPLSPKAYHALGEAGLIPEQTGLFHRVLPPSLHVQPEQPIVCGDSVPEPDLSVIRGAINDYPTEHPRTAELVLEICVTSHDYDRSKLRAHATVGVKECWLVLGLEKQIEVHAQPSGEQFTERAVHGPGGRLTSTEVRGFTVELDRLFTAGPECQ